MRRLVFCGLILILLAPVCLQAAAANYSGVWEGEVLWVKAVAEIKQQGKKISGVCYIIPLFGNKRTYHFKGTLDNGRVKAAHYSGHRFEGRIISAKEIRGILTSKDGGSVKVTAHKK